MGAHLAKSWSVNQSTIALSSVEATYYGLGIGMKNILAELLVDVKSRLGVGTIWHIEVSKLWIQEHVANGSITVNKYSGMIIQQTY